MGKKGTWIKAVKKAFRSPSKDKDRDKEKEKDVTKNVPKFADTVGDLPLVEVPVKPKGRRRWSFGKSLHQSSSTESKDHAADKQEPNPYSKREQVPYRTPDMSVATSCSATPVHHMVAHSAYSREDLAAIRLQAAFRAYLARRALRALRGLVRLQALVRGHTVRRQATITLRCMQALVRVQARVRARRVRMSDEGQAVQRQLLERRQQDSRPRRSMDGGWDDSTQTPEEIQAKLQNKQEAALKRERALAYAFSRQLWKAAPNQMSQMYIDCEPDKPHWGWSWLERWMAARPWENRILDSTSVSKDVFDGYSVKSPDRDHHNVQKKAGGDPRLKKQPSSLNHNQPAPSAARTRMSGLRISPESCSRNDPAMSAPSANGHGHSHSHYSPGSVQRTSSQHAPVTPLSAYKTAPVLIRSASPRARVRREDIEEAGSQASTAGRSTTTPSGPARYSTRHCFSHAGSVKSRDDESCSPASVPNYMQATQSAKAKVRSYSTPRQRPGTPEKDNSSWTSKKRLSLPVTHDNNIILRPLRPPAYATQRSPSRRIDQRSVLSVGNDSHQSDATPATSEVSGLRPALYR